MYPSPEHVLKEKSGALSTTPLPLLLHALSLSETSGILELRHRGIEKRISFEEGAPVACRSNLLHETLGRFLVEKGKLQEADYQLVLAECARTGTKMGEVLATKGLISAFELYRYLKENLARKILECFRWGEAEFRLEETDEIAESPVKMNVVQLILTGISNFMPFESVANHFAFTDQQRFALAPKPPHSFAELKLSGKNARLVQVMRSRPVFADVVTQSGLDAEGVIRRLYGLAVLGMIDRAESVGDKAPEPPPAVVAPAPVAPKSGTGAPGAGPNSAQRPSGAQATSVQASGHEAEEEEADDALKNALLGAFLDHRAKNPFELLGVPVEVQPVALRKAFLAATDKLNPMRFRSEDLREKAEAMLVAYARAYGSLCEPETLELWKKRHAAAQAAKAAPKKDTATEQFKIQTKLLDARSQFAEARKRLEAKNYRGALEYFEFASEIEPRAQFRAYMAWCRFLLNPAAHARLALQELGEAERQDGTCEEAPFFTGEIHRQRAEYPQAAEAYKRAYKLNPQNRRAAELVHEVTKLAKSK